LAVGALALLFTAPGDDAQPTDAPTAREVSATQAFEWPAPARMPTNPASPPNGDSSDVQQRLNGAASAAGTALGQELDRVLAPFVESREQD
jgi:hypothetical protein